MELAFNWQKIFIKWKWCCYSLLFFLFFARSQYLSVVDVIKFYDFIVWGFPFHRMIYQLNETNFEQQQNWCKPFIRKRQKSLWNYFR